MVSRSGTDEGFLQTSTRTGAYLSVVLHPTPSQLTWRRRWRGLAFSSTALCLTSASLRDELEKRCSSSVRPHRTHSGPRLTASLWEPSERSRLTLSCALFSVFPIRRVWLALCEGPRRQPRLCYLSIYSAAVVKWLSDKLECNDNDRDS